MIFSFDLLINAIVSGILIGAFYAAVTAGVSISFGILDIVNIAHPAFITRSNEKIFPQPCAPSRRAGICPRMLC